MTCDQGFWTNADYNVLKTTLFQVVANEQIHVILT